MAGDLIITEQTVFIALWYGGMNLHPGQLISIPSV